MRDIENVITDFIALLDKAKWIKMYIEHSDMVSKRSTEIFFRSTQIPRDVRWKDPLIIDLIELSDRQRELYDELHQFYGLTILKDIDTLIAKIDEKISLLKNKSLKRTEILSMWLNEIKQKKENHKIAWIDNKVDPWYTEYDLKKTIQLYLTADYESNNELQEFIIHYEDILKELNIEYKNIALKYIKIQKNHFTNIAETLDRNIFDSVTFNKSDIFYDIPDNEYSEREYKINGEKEKANLENIYDELVVGINEEMKTLKNEFIKKEFKVRKHGIYNVKNYNCREYKPMFILITETNFIHCYDIKNDDTSELILKLAKISQRTSPSFFENSKIISLTQQEENKLKELSEKYFDEIDYTKNILKGFPIFTKEKHIKLLRDKSEITITNKKGNNMLSIFWDSSIKIKGYTLKDIYDLYFSIINENTLEETLEKTESDEKGEDVILKPTSLYNVEKIYEKIIEDNPWKTY